MEVVLKNVATNKMKITLLGAIVTNWYQVTTFILPASLDGETTHSGLQGSPSKSEWSRL